ncbi:MAG: transglutaminase domain-containing protein [Candidatus Omnitrophota bacterium]
MKKLSVVLFVLLFQACTSFVFAQDKAQELLRDAGELAHQTEYKKAEQVFLQAREEFLKQENKDMARQCLLGAWQMRRVLLQYPHTQEQARKLLKDAFPDVGDKERDSWFAEGRVDFLQVGEEKLYFEGAANNVAFRDIPLIQKTMEKKGEQDPFFDEAWGIVFRAPKSGYPARAWKPLVNPVKYLVEYSLVIPREKLPKEGTLKLWVPLPIQTEAQVGSRVVSVSPEEYLKMPPQLNAEIGIAYLEVDLGALKEKLDISISALFSRYEERYAIDPANVGEYDKESELYKRYTRSQKNIPVNEEFRKKALEITGGEKNPYLAAGRIYHYILENIRYSYVPHVMLDALDIPEAVFVMNNSYGDCGAQSMYFSSLCRSIGIPARSCGGLQLFPGIEGDHFGRNFIFLITAGSRWIRRLPRAPTGQPALPRSRGRPTRNSISAILILTAWCFRMTLMFR